MTRPDDQIADFLADRAMEGLSPQESAELSRLLEASPGTDAEAFDRVAAALAVALSPPNPGAMPAALRARILAQARPKFGPRPKPKPRRFLAVAGWSVAAAGWLVAAWAWSPPKAPESPEIGMERLRGEVGSIPFKATAHPLAQGASGDLVWSQDRQSGYLKLTGLAPIDPSRGAYQLWIFDEARDTRYPVDGGVFTIAEGSKPVVVEIHIPLHVNRPGLFAVTLEPAGGVVVSDRTRILMTAGPWKP